MTENAEPIHYRSGFVAIIGRPNVGKSTLMNRILGERIAITTHKPQTTRQRIVGVRHFDDGQIVYLDTPGIHQAKGKLNRYMIDTAIATMQEGDVVYFMMEVGPKFTKREDMGEGNRRILEELAKAGRPVFLVINKVDLESKEALLPFIDRQRNMFEFDQIHLVSARTGDGVEQLVTSTRELMPEGPPYYPEDMVTDRTMRFLASEIVREKTMLVLRDEVPYSLGVFIQRFLELDGGTRYHIDADLVIERESQKGIVIGKGGATLKKIGEKARKDLERFFESEVGLKLFVRVRKNWTDDPHSLDELGYK